MKKRQIQGIEDLLKGKNEVKLQDVARIHSRLMRNYPMPTIEIEDYEKCSPGSPLMIRMKGMPAPAVDVFKGKIAVSEQNDLELPMYATFRTTSGTTLRPLKRIKEDCYSVVLPSKLTNGLVGILFPIQENFGHQEVLDGLSIDIQNWIKRSKHVSRSILTKDDCPSLSTPLQNFRYLAAIFPQPLRFSFSVNCSICPFGALKIAATYCYIDPVICKGQKYSRLNGTARGPEEICWNCFNAGDGTVSTKCDYVTLRKVLHLNPDAPFQEVPCCGGCEISDLCPRGAIYKPPEYPNFFTADKARCNGCMECYLNKDCPWNCGTNCSSECEHFDRDDSILLYNGSGGYYSKNIHSNYTMRMVAQIDEKLTLTLVKIQYLSDIEFYLPWPRPYAPYPDLTDSGSSSKNMQIPEFDLIVWGDKVEKIPIKLDKTGIQRFKSTEIPFTKSIHLGLFEKDGRLLGFSHCGSNIPIKSLGAKRYSDPTKLSEGGIFKFDSTIGRIQIKYFTKQGSPEKTGA